MKGNNFEIDEILYEIFLIIIGHELYLENGIFSQKLFGVQIRLDF